MLANYYGEILSIFVALLWSATALFFESAIKKVGAMPVNFSRLVIAFLFLAVYCQYQYGYAIPFNANGHQWFWMVMSGIVGFVIGDLFLFKAIALIGARISLLIMSLAPPLTAFLGFIFLDEKLTLLSFLAMLVILTGISLVIISKENGQKFKFSHSLKGVLFGIVGAAGQAGGLVLSKIGMGELNAFQATQIRILTGIVGFGVMIAITKQWMQCTQAFTNKKALTQISMGAFVGPFLGVSFSLLALKYTTAGIAATLMALTPIFIIPIAYFAYHEKSKWKEIIGAIVAISGVALLFL